ncbi:YaiI/YqxD family protein [Paraburkholderia saeva]|uniref:UPF0178 protein LMG31841_05395 n=1 Tax=Paraburkholderia saeva TaxID=2777537 RepID=A0A9N8S266_9BURK|nr:YaiI/YqxD family protein [Paraburkholderia saeva]CAG4909573.1 hypothetical protein R52603_03741 [Paraburkholderia saeva]CAG4912278.1 hypothetical protein R70241_04015 [Paraburkholderia saeva]CAG4924544.1 hypothetical protein LMG31841_05395 [Paraburkholderia saeva]
MQIWVDADACPVVIKDMLFRAARRVSVTVTLVANQFLRVPPSPLIRTIQVPAGADAADDLIAERVQVGDLVITADIPLAAAVLQKNAHALDPRGNWYSAGTIEERLRMRAMLDQLRGSGIDTGGPSAFSARDTKTFAGELDRWLLRHAPRPVPPSSAPGDTSAPDGDPQGPHEG